MESKLCDTNTVRCTRTTSLHIAGKHYAVLRRSDPSETLYPWLLVATALGGSEWVPASDFVPSSDAASGLTQPASALAAKDAEIARLTEALKQVAAPAPSANDLGLKAGCEYWCNVAVRRQDIAFNALTPRQSDPQEGKSDV